MVIFPGRQSKTRYEKNVRSPGNRTVCYTLLAAIALIGKGALRA